MRPGCPYEVAQDPHDHPGDEEIACVVPRDECPFLQARDRTFRGGQDRGIGLQGLSTSQQLGAVTERIGDEGAQRGPSARRE